MKYSFENYFFICSTTLTPRQPSLSEEWAPVKTISYPWSCSWRLTRRHSSTAPSSSLTADILIHATALEYTLFVNVQLFIKCITLCMFQLILSINECDQLSYIHSDSYTWRSQHRTSVSIRLSVCLSLWLSLPASLPISLPVPYPPTMGHPLIRWWYTCIV